jgi:hypothetical protein
VIVHQRSPGSSDLSFDLEVVAWGLPIATHAVGFDKLIGADARQISPGAKIQEAKLSVSASNALDYDLYHVEQACVSRKVVVRPIPASAEGSTREFDVKQSLQAWANGEPNEGWAILANRGDAKGDSQLQLRLAVQFWPEQ